MSVLAVVAVLLAPAQPDTARAPIIDVHLHAYSLADFAGGFPNCADPREIAYPAVDPRSPMTFDRVKACQSRRPAPATDDDLMRDSLGLLERYNIRAITSGALERVTAWRSAAPDRIIPAVSFESRDRTPEQLRRLVADQEVAVFAEVGAQYRGLRVDDPSYDAYFALAEELDIPVGIHLGEGPVGGPHRAGYGAYRAGLTSPFQVEQVLVRHPRLRVYVMHYASPLLDEMIAVLFSHPQLYVDVSGNNWLSPRAQFYSHLQRLLDAGFSKRILWGSDQMVWPWAIEVGLEAIEAAPFLTKDQKRDILYNNAARFLRFSDDEIARDHAPPSKPSPKR